MRPSITNVWRLLGYSGYQTPWLSYTALYIIAILIAGVCILSGQYSMTPDSINYIEASEALMRGEPHIMRPPVYPLIIGLSRLMLGADHQIHGVIIVQWITFIISIVYFRNTLALLISSARCLFWATAVYAICPVFYVFNQTLLTEGLAGSFVIFFLYCLTNDSPGLKRALWSGIWLLILVYLRPAMICLLPVYGFYWGYVLYRQRKSGSGGAVTAGVIMALIIVSLIGYKHIIHNEFGTHTISVASVVNNWYILREQDAIGEEHADAPKVKAFLDSLHGTSPWTGQTLHWDEDRYLREVLRLSWPEIEAINARAIADNPWFYLRSFKMHLWQLKCHTFMPGYVYAAPIKYGGELMPLSISCFVAFMSFAGVLLVWRVRRIMPWVLFLTAASIAGAALIGSMNEWDRMFNPCMGAAWMLCVYLMLPAVRAWQRGFSPDP